MSDRIDNNELFDFSTLNEIVEEYNEFIHASYKKIENNVEISEQSDEVIEELNNIIELPADDIIKKMMTIQLNTEFGNQINNIYNIRKGEIIISDKQSNDFSLIIENNKISKISNYSSLDQFTVEYIDDPYVIDRLSDYSFRTLDIYFENHREALKNDLKKEMKPLLREMINEKNTENVLDFEQIDEAVNGRVFYDREKRKYVYKQPNKSETLNVENVSSGVKSLLILKTLLLNGSINKDSLLVLDEPEVHLHPEWQLLFSRLVISIQKKLGVKILVTTHSPYFLNAIEILSKKMKLIQNII
ncbi:ATP-binding protein [Limosilactobacillus reuteri]|uniref:ATP-binding protein n=1 Tax=Limosilactobacillus reuteri TaxID=1598 RepID=A0AAW4X6N8_LIMRT|nr:ATP-binding protein [Limosilactobacillus reuteri]MCC4495888.1 ATP-binding protein [Limosilactobacillus reuteri]MCC4498020.1 ATP-binding protein [Limosilactobacillus reuteri]